MKFLDSTADYPQAPGVVLIKVPKTMALLEQQLRALRKVVTPETRIIAGAKARDIHTSTLELFEKVLGPTTTTLARKSAPDQLHLQRTGAGRRAGDAELETGRHRLDHP